MAEKTRPLIPGLFDSTDEEEDAEGPALQPIESPEEIVVDRATPEAVVEQVVVTTEEEDNLEDAIPFEEPEEQGGGEPQGEAVEDEEVEEEYDPNDALIPLRPRKPAAQAFDEVSLASQATQQSVNETLEVEGAREEKGDVEVMEEESVDQNTHYFVVDVHMRRVRILPGGYDEKMFTPLEKIPAESLPVLHERVHSPNPDDDDHVYCELCVMSFRVCCFKHPLYRILDRPVPGPVEGRAKKTLPAFIRIETSSIPGAGLGAFTITELPVGLVFGPYQGVLSKESDNRGYSWEIRNVGAPPVYLDGSDPMYSNWMRYINSPRHDREQNMVAFQYNGSVYYRVMKPIDCKQELLVWYGAKYGESLGVFSTKRSSKKNWSVNVAEVKNPFIM